MIYKSVKQYRKKTVKVCNFTKIKLLHRYFSRVLLKCSIFTSLEFRNSFYKGTPLIRCFFILKESLFFRKRLSGCFCFFLLAPICLTLFAAQEDKTFTLYRMLLIDLNITYSYAKDIHFNTLFGNTFQ